MEVNQIYDTVNVAANMVLGNTAIVAVDTSTFVSLGEQLGDAGTEVRDMFNNVLYDVIARTVMSIRSYEDDNTDGMIMDGFTYGAYLRKIYCDVGNAMENPAYNIGKEGFEAKYAPVYKPVLKQYMFSKTGTFEYGVSIPDDLYDSAFHSESEMAVLISAIMVALQNQFNLAVTELRRLTRATYIANVINDGNINAVNLLSQYNTAFGKTLTADTALADETFLRWSSMTINRYSNMLVEPSTLFNRAGNKHHTPKEYQVLTILNDYEQAVKYNLMSNVFHNELVKLPKYNTAMFWQGTGEEYSFKDASTVSIKITTESGSTSLTYPYVLAILYDVEAMGACIDKVKDKSQYYPHEEFTNHWKKATKGFFNDFSENAIVFYMA